MIFEGRFFMVFFKEPVCVPYAETIFQACTTGAVLPECTSSENAKAS